MGRTEIDLFGIVHVKEGYIPVFWKYIEIDTIRILVRFVWSTHFVQCGIVLLHTYKGICKKTFGRLSTYHATILNAIEAVEGWQSSTSNITPNARWWGPWEENEGEVDAHFSTHLDLLYEEPSQGPEQPR